MDKQQYDFLEDSPALVGPDYVAVVIEWEDDDAVTQLTPLPKAPRRSLRTVATVAGAVGALAVAAWGVHRLRAA